MRLRACVRAAARIGARVVAGPIYAPVGRTWPLDPTGRRATIRRLVERLRPLADAKGIELSVSAPGDPLEVRSDRRALSQILINLANNAIKFTDEGGVRIDTHGASTSYGPGGAWFESGPEPVFAQGADRPTRFVRVMVLPRALLGKRVAGLFSGKPESVSLFLALLIAFLPAACIGLLFRKAIKAHLFGPGPVAAALVVGGIVMIVVGSVCMLFHAQPVSGRWLLALLARVVSGASFDSVHRMTTKDARVTTELRILIPIARELSTNMRISSAMRWSGLSAASPSSCMR